MSTSNVETFSANVRHLTEAKETKVLGRFFLVLSLPLKTAFGTIGNCRLRLH